MVYLVYITFEPSQQVLVWGQGNYYYFILHMRKLGLREEVTGPRSHS